MMDNKPEECNVCFDIYDEVLRQPRALPCGHTFCSQCIELNIKNDHLTCPSCRVQHSATAATQFPINHGMEDLIRKFKGIQLMPREARSAKPHPDCSRRISRKLQSMVEKQKSSTNSLISECEEALSQLGKYQRQVMDWKTQHQQLHDRLYELVEQNKAAIELLEQEDNIVVNMTTEGKAGKKQLQVMLQCLDTVNNAQEAIITIDEADQCSVEAEDWIQKCQELFPDANTVHTSLKVQERLREALEVTTKTDVTASPLLEDSASTIMEKVEKIIGRIVQVKFTVEHLCGMSESVKQLVEAGQVFAVQQDQDNLRSARITFQGGQVYLHTLLHQTPPDDTCTLQHSEVMKMLRTSTTLTFLDLAWAGSTRGRVHIRLNPDTVLARQFVMLCTGERGPTYLKTKFVEVWNKGQPGERVWGGDYQHNNGQGGAPLLPDLPFVQQFSGRAGSVLSRHMLSRDQSAQFAITTKDRTGIDEYINVVGEVESGLDVVRAAANHSNIMEVTVVDCGVVLTL